MLEFRPNAHGPYRRSAFFGIWEAVYRILESISRPEITRYAFACTWAAWQIPSSTQPPLRSDAAKAVRKHCFSFLQARAGQGAKKVTCFVQCVARPSSLFLNPRACQHKACDI